MRIERPLQQFRNNAQERRNIPVMVPRGPGDTLDWRKDDQMSAEYQSGGKTRKHPSVRRIVIVAIVVLAIVEPLVMYHSLMRERDRRQQAFAQMQQSDADTSVTDPGR
jgi:hypothetical protein